MRLGYDPQKDAWDTRERGLSFGDVASLDWTTAAIRQDRRRAPTPLGPPAPRPAPRPFAEMFPKQFKALKKGGRPPMAQPKLHIGFRLAADMVQGVRATGPGYNARVEKVLREALAKGEV